MQTCLVTGATGYVGGRLVPKLLDLGYTVKAASRSLHKLEARPWANHTQLTLVPMDAFDYPSVLSALQGCDVAYYFIHSMSREHKDFIAADKQAAHVFAKAATEAGIKRIIYLGGLGPGPVEHNLSPHLASRHEVGTILQSGQVPVTILRAAMIIGSGSASFEILRYLVERLPVMLAPKWVYTQTQPIAIRNVLNYLTGCLEQNATIGETFDIGGPDVLTYLDLMHLYAQEAKLPKRFVIPIPFFTPTISAYWIHFVTPVHAALARPLAEGLRNITICHENRIQPLIPQNLYSCQRAIHLALERYMNHEVPTRWTDAGKLPPPESIYPGDPNWSGGLVYIDKRSMTVESSLSHIWNPIIRIGGERGWYYGNFLWHLRGIMDLFFGGVGLGRGRRHPDSVQVGDALDFWRVLDVQLEKRLFLKAEMQIPGDAFLEFTLKPMAEGQVEVTQTARFAPKGLMGIAYWFAVTPLHHFIFTGMLTGIAKAEQIPIIKGPVFHAKGSTK
jgi:uncharacterized protein YbjT (DUF2867 family)